MSEPWRLLQASGSAPEAQTLHQLSQAKQDESLEAQRLKRDLQTLHTDPSTLGPTPYPQTAATAATIAGSEQAAQQTAGVAPAAELQLQAASALVNPDQLAASSAAAPADTAAAVTAVEGSAPADSTHADKPSAGTAVNDVVDVAEPEVGNDGAHADGSEAVAADEDAVMPQASNVTQEDSKSSKMPDAPEDEGPPADVVLPLDTRVTDRQKEGDVHDHTKEEEQKGPGASDATCTEPAVQQPVEDELQEEPQQSKSAAPAKPKGKRKAAVPLKGNVKRQKGKQDDREASPAPDTAAGKTAAPSQKEDADVAPVRAAAAAKPAASKAQSVAAEAAATKQGGRFVKKGASSASGAGIKKAAAKPSAAATKKGGAATSGAKRKASAAALASDSDADDTDNDKADHSADDAPDEAVEAAAAEADEAVAAPPVSRDRRNKAKEAKLPPAPQPAQAVKKATKQQKLPFTKAAPSSPKPGKGAAAATATSAAAAASAGTGSKTSKGKASDKKSGASSEPASSAKEPKGKQVHKVRLLARPQAEHVLHVA